jgi:glucan-binding YG repeat protein
MTGLAGIEGSLYYFDGGGRMVTGWQFIDGGYYFFGGDGRLVQDAVFEDAAGVPVQVDSAGLLVAPEGYIPS